MVEQAWLDDGDIIVKEEVLNDSIPKNKIPKIFEGFYLASARIITFLCIAFTLIIQNVTFLPTIQNPKVTFVFALATAWIGIAVTYFSLKYGLEIQ